MNKQKYIELIKSLDESTDQFDKDVDIIKEALPDFLTNDQLDIVKALLTQGPELLEYLDLI